MTMQGFPLSSSPRTQSLQMQDQGAQVEELFNDGFTQRAYDMLGKMFPDLLAGVVTLKIQESDPDEGTAKGFFILDHNQEIFYIPAVFSNNEVKPLDVFYSKRLDRYLPLTPEWLNEATKSNVAEMGHPVQAPKTLQTDVDIRNLVVPPTTGRYSYASAKDGPGFPEMLERCSDAVKLATLRAFADRPTLFKTAVEIYGRARLAKALKTAGRTDERLKLAPEKSDTREQKQKHDKFRAPAGGNVLAADKATSAAKLKEMFGDDAGTAYSTIRTRGFYAKDYRKQRSGAVVQTKDREVKLEEPATSGLYRVYLADGTAEVAFVLCDVLRLDSAWDGHKFDLKNRTGGRPHPAPGYRQDTFPPSRAAARQKYWVVLFKDGRYCETKALVAEPIVASHAECEQFLGKADAPKTGDYGLFLSTVGLTFRGTEAGWVDNVRDSGERKVVTLSGFKVVLDPAMRGKTVVYPANQNALYVPASYRFVRCGTRVSPDLICNDPRGGFKHVEQKMKTAGARPVEVARRDDGFYYVGRNGPGLSKAAALRELALAYDVPLGHAEQALKLAEAGAARGLWAVDYRALAKLAADDSGSSSKSKGGGGGGGGGADPAADPNAMPMDPAMMAPPGPPQPTSIELAAAEMMQQLQAQQDSLGQQMQLLQQVAARAQQIESSGAGVMAAPLAAQMIAPPPPSAPPGAAPPADPNAAGAGAPPGADPMAGGVDPATGMPMEAAPPPMARMTSDRLTPETLPQAINPQYMEDAAGLADAQVFDAAGIASLAQGDDTMELAQAYMPKMEAALDSLCRLLTLFNMKEEVIKEQFGQESYAMTQQKLRDLVKGLGDTLLKVEQMGQHRAPDYADAR